MLRMVVRVVLAAAFIAATVADAGIGSFVSPSASLRWDSMRPGVWSDGILTVPVDRSDPSLTIALHVRGRAAASQPARLGTMLVHCGGPGSDRHCGDTFMGRTPGVVQPFPDQVVETVRQDMNIWSIDQRGIGSDNTPNLACDRIWRPRHTKASYQISDFTDCECAVPDGTHLVQDMDPDNETQARHIYKGEQERGERCYNAARFQLKNSKNISVNLLDFIGTSSLAEDIETFRSAVGADVMNIYGTSYGTGVAAAYASMFPSHSGRILLNGNMDSSSDLLTKGKGTAKTCSQAIEHLLRLCAEQESCSLHADPYASWDRMMHLLSSSPGVSALDAKGVPFRLSAGNVLEEINDKLFLGELKGEEHAALQIVSGLLSSNVTTHVSTVESVLDSQCSIQIPGQNESVITWRDYSVCIGMGQIAGDPTSAMDYTGRYTTDQFVHHWRNIRSNYPLGSTAYVEDVAGTASWPGTPTPSAPYGDPKVKALVVGNLYDPRTGYSRSQRMHRGFPSGALMTWQGVGHTLQNDRGLGNDPVGTRACVDKMYRYMLYGELPPNGFTCHNGVKPQV